MLTKSNALDVLLLVDVRLLLDLVDVDVRNLGGVAVDDLGELLEGGAARLDVHEVDKGKLEGDPALQSRWLDQLHTEQGLELMDKSGLTV